MSISKDSTESQMESLAPARGASVISSDGEQFAYVKEVRGGYFELDVPMARDFWLSCAYIESADDRQVRLSITRDDVDEHRLSAPGIETSDDPHRADVEDKVISNEEALTQRERMERELAEQRARLEKERAETAGVIDPGYHP